jgi:orotidine-5'-phosphate decarboxylase
VKLGSRLFAAEGPAAAKALSRLTPGIFLDLKFHDIPNTVAGAAATAAKLPGVRMLTLHAAGGLEMMLAARRAVPPKPNAPKLLGVTVLTSLNRSEMRRIGLAGPLQVRAVKLARLAQQAGLDGVVTSAREARAIRRACGRRFLILVPGVRPASCPVHDDQSRVATPAAAIAAGADYVVVGRPITAAQDPRAAALAILKEISAAAGRA